MQWKHNFKHIDASPSLQEYVEAHLGKLTRYLLKDSQWQVFYSKGKHHDCSVDVTVHEGNGHYKASAHEHDWYLAVDKVFAKLEKQFRKKKEKLQSHREVEMSKEGQLERVNTRLEYDSSPYPTKKPA